MNASVRARVGALALVAVVSAATTAVVLPVATAQSPAPAPQMVVGLPDFTHLVEQVGPGVVNIEATLGSRGARLRGQLPDDAQIPEIFRRFFGPGMPFPGMPQDPADGPRGVSQGTGFLISADGYVLTNHHVVDGADAVKVKLSDRREFTAQVVGSDEQSDVALLKIDAGGLPALRLGDSSQLKPGQWVVAIGSPFGLDHSVTAGIVSAVGRSAGASQQYVPFIQTDVAINRGNSGGPLLNTRGEVVGINSQIFSNSGGYMGVSFAIPIDLAMNSVKQLKATGKVQRGMIGVGLQPITADLAQGLGLPDTRGALIREVSPGSAGEKAGLRVGDVIRSVDGRAIGQSSELPPIVGAKAPGTRIRLGVLRDGAQREIAVVLAPLDETLLPGNGGQGPRDRTAPVQPSSNPLGLIGEPLDAADRRQLGLQPGEGVGIARVEGLAARSAGVRAGDVVLKVGRSAVGSPAELDRALRDVRPGQTVMLLLSRNGNSQFVAVTPRTDDRQ
ncbi:Do family serine endopeptidase [Cognatiluteimonas weifangensis]|uniref:Probable periplasmic serine endoprotease DegP-like n=1 Tax=Cognatiluteimonas weifangensis TaxID=2303539 RepID=A0A372DK51_9GAMM|nr:Do family serine endopeptidase [Luteimonas weifangensis]RFP59981.1 Do family serine endopeptidase [Luteimonas weifangensis]